MGKQIVGYYEDNFGILWPIGDEEMESEWSCCGSRDRFYFKDCCSPSTLYDVKCKKCQPQRWHWVVFDSNNNTADLKVPIPIIKMPQNF